MRFRLMAGTYIDPKGDKHAANDPKTCIIESDVDLVRKFGAKFAMMEGGGKNQQVWNEDKETFAEFAARMAKQGKVPSASPAPVATAPAVSEEPKAAADAQPRSPKDEEFERTLNEMTLDQLRKHAEDEEIDLKGAKHKADVLKAILAAYGK